MIAYTVEIKGLDEQLAKLKRYDQIADKRLITAMSQATITIESEVKPLTPVFQARLRNSIGSKVEREGPLSIVGTVGSSLKDEEYPAVMEFGRRKGAKMPPPQALERWVYLVLGVPKEEAPGVAYVVARSIARKGIKGRKFMERGYKKARPKVLEFFARALDLIAEDLSIGGT